MASTGGDASTVYLSKIQDPEVAAGFVGEDTAANSTALARGRQGFLHLGALRTKPGMRFIGQLGKMAKTDEQLEQMLYQPNRCRAQTSWLATAISAHRVPYYRSS